MPYSESILHGGYLTDALWEGLLTACPSFS
jgi:hypothetical protein